MEQFVLGIFQEQLSKFIVGFRKEQVNANLLNGKGEIHNVELNCAFLNETINRVSPLFELERVHVSKLSFHVSSWTNLRKAPILVDIEHVRAVVVEPLHFLQKKERKQIRQITKSELMELIRIGLQPVRNAYNIFDRIMDNLTIEIVSVHIDFQPRGKFKTRRVGPWTPPAIEIALAGIRIYSVNEYGQEAPPEEVWRHNHHNDGTLMIYKKLEMEYQISIRPVGLDRIPLVSGLDNKMEVHVALHRRLRDGEVLAIQVDATVPKLEVEIPADAVQHLAHVLAGVAYTLSKDRAFVDPLKPVGTATDDESPEAQLTISASESADMDDMLEDVAEENDFIPKDLDADNSSSSSSEGEDEAPVQKDKVPASNAAQATGKPSAAQSLPFNKTDHPVIVLPNGIVIHDKLTFSLSVHNTTVRGTYAPKEDGYIQMVAKGCIVEAIWPKVTQEKGGYAQASVSYLSVQEGHGRRLRTVLVGGVQFDNTGPVEKPSKPLKEISRDESFPLFENRSVRVDPVGLRHSFPAQAFGLKTTIDFITKLSSEPEGSKEAIQVLHEIGVDKFDVVLDTHAWCRAIRFALNEDGRGFDPRWHTGDWTDSLKPDMLANPKAPLNLDDCLQPTKQLFLDENELISSDLFNVTARITNVDVRVPAPIHEDARSCDIVIRMDETMLVISSALPRTFLSGKIGSSIYGDDAKTKGVIDFPNDPSDIAYVLENTEDPSDRQRGVMTSRAMSTFRLQLTLRGFSVRIVPIVLLCEFKEPQQLLAPSEMTMVVCFDGEPPDTPDSNLTKAALFVSILAHRFEINLDFDLAASAVSTLVHHTEVVEATLADCLKLFESQDIPDTLVEPSESSVDYSVSSADLRIQKSLRGRRVLVQRQISLSRETGGISVALCLQLAEFRLQLWRHNVPYSSPLRASHRSDAGTDGVDEKYVPLLQLMDFSVNGIEFAVEGSFHQHNRRIIVKGCLSEVRLKGCDIFGLLQDVEVEANPDSPAGGEQGVEAEANPDSPTGGEAEVPPPSKARELLEVFALGAKAFLGDDTDEGTDQGSDYGVAIRFEERLEGLEGTRAWSLASDIASRGVVSCRVEVIETLVVLILEALLMPTWSKSKRLESHAESEPELFPARTVGALFMSLIPDDISSVAGIGPLRIDEEVTLDLVGAVPGKGLDRMLRDLIANVLPDDLDLLLLRTHISNFLVNVPGGSFSTSPDDFSGFGLLLHQLDFSASYFGSTGALQSGLLGMLARKGEAWSSVIETQEQGLRHRMLSRQSLNAVVPRDGVLWIKDHLVPAFDAGYTYSDSKAFLSLDKGLAIDNLEMIDQFITCLSIFAGRCKKTASNIAGTLATMRAPIISSIDAPSPDTEGIVALNPVGIACSRSAASIRSVRELLRRVSEGVATRDQSLQSLLMEREKELENLRLTVFAKEKERIGALALTASQVTGWLRVGGAQRIGQRGLISCMLWPHWSVVRRSLLITYSGPGKHTPVDIVSLRGATLHELGGGRKKRDLKRAFAIVEATGMTRLVIAGSDAEYYTWVSELQKAIGSFSVSLVATLQPDLGIPGAGEPIDEPFDRNVAPDGESDRPRVDVDGLPDATVDGSLSQSSNHGRPLGRSLSRAAQVAKVTGQAVVGRGRRKQETGDGPTGGSTIASSVVAVPTKELVSPPSMISSMPTPSEPEDTTGLGQARSQATPPMSMSSTEETSEHSGGPNRRVQIRSKFAGVGQVTKSRFGSALQAAKQKGRAVAEKGREVAERRRQRGIDDEDGTPRASTLEPPPTVSDNKSEGQTSTGDQYAPWACLSCTCLNPPENASCRVCGTVHDREETKLAATAAEIQTVVPDWACLSCTCLNPTENVSCQVCGTVHDREETKFAAVTAESQTVAPDAIEALDDNHKTDSNNDGETSFGISTEDDPKHEDVHGDGNESMFSDFADDLDSESQGPRRGMRERLGAAVRSVRIGKDDEEGIPRNSGRFSLRRRGTRQDNANGRVQGAPDPVKLRNIMIKGPLDSPTHPFGDISSSTSDLPLKRLEGSWFVRVATSSSHQEAEGSEEIEENQKSTPSQLSGAVVATNDSSTEDHRESQEIDSATSTMSREPGTETSDPELPTRAGTSQYVDGARNSAPYTPEPKNRLAFQLQVFNHRTETTWDRPVVKVDKTLSEVLQLHTELSESIARVPSSFSDTGKGTGRSSAEMMSASLAAALGLTALDTVRITGRLLGGLLENVTTEPDSEASLNYHAEVISEFINSMLDCPFPIDGLAALTDFLLINASTQDATSSATGIQKETSADLKLSSQSSRQHFVGEIYSPAVICEAELLRAEHQSLLAERLAKASISSRPGYSSAGLSFATIREPILPSSTTERFQDAMHSALMKVMEERDEAHAKMVAADVLHVHEIGQQKKKSAHLVTQLDVAQKTAAANVNPINRFRITEDPKEKERLRMYERAMQQNSDEELVALCQQLGAEISARTSASLETLRLKESRNIEREHEASEKQALKDELKRAKELLALEQGKAEELKRESERWQHSYVDIIQDRESKASKS